ncbi:MAG: hypothetical protein HQ515_12765, partial [Phycisphaeraceae bacterium]|nr:hypothetical protein [Phycisphaeraceae bacterium]
MPWNKICLVSMMLSFWATSAWSTLVVIENPSFEAPQVDPNAFQALPMVDQWIEQDNDVEYSANTGVFPNPDINSPGHLAHAHGKQLAFLGSEQGNSLAQILTAQYEPGVAYRMTVSVGVSGMFPPSELNSLALVFYTMDSNEPVDVVTQSVSTSGVSSTALVDYSVVTRIVTSDHAWAGQPIGIAIRSVGPASGFWDLDHVRVEELAPVALDIENASFETPVVDPNAFQALPYVNQWVETDNDMEYSANTGVFPNPSPGSPGSLLHTNGQQLAFLGSEQGNGFEQGLQSIYQPGFSYQLTIGVGVSALFPPSAENSVAVVFYFVDNNEPVDIASQIVSASDYTSTMLQDVTANLGPVGPNDIWVGQPLGIAIRSVGPASGFWDLDNVRLSELLPTLNAIENPSFEDPTIDPNTFPVLPFVDHWVEYDQDALGSTN